MIRRSSAAAALCAAAMTAGCGGELDDRSFEGLALDPELANARRLGSAVRVRPAPDGCVVAAQMTADDRFAIRSLEPLVPVLAATAVDFGLGVVQRRLDEREAGLTGGFVARGALPDLVAGETYCLVLHHGLMGAWREGAVASGRLADEEPNLAELGLADMPAFYMESLLTVKARDEVTELTLQPVYVAYAETSARERGSGRKAVSVAIALHGDEPPTADAAADGALGVFRLDLGRLPIGVEIDATEDGAGLAGTGSRVVVDAPRPPSNIAAVVVEAETPGAAFAAMKAAFEDNTDDLAAALAEIISEALGAGEE